MLQISCISAAQMLQLRSIDCTNAAEQAPGSLHAANATEGEHAVQPVLLGSQHREAGASCIRSQKPISSIETLPDAHQPTKIKMTQNSAPPRRRHEHV